MTLQVPQVDYSNYFLNSTHLTYLKNTHQNIWGWDGSAYDSYSNSNASGGSLDYIAPGDEFFGFTEMMKKLSPLGKLCKYTHGSRQGFRNSSVSGGTDDTDVARLALIKFSVFDANSKRYLSVVFGDDFSMRLDPGEDIGGFRAGDSHIYTQVDGWSR